MRQIGIEFNIDDFERVTRGSSNPARAALQPGDTLYTVLRHVAASGASRSIDVYGFWPDRIGYQKNARLVARWYSRLIADAEIAAWDKKHEAVRISGGGMDMGFALVYGLSSALFPDGFGCIGAACPSNDHHNGDADYNVNESKPGEERTHWHLDGGYALRQDWI